MNLSDIKVSHIHAFGIWRLSLAGFHQDTFGKRPGKSRQARFLAFVNNQQKLNHDMTQKLKNYIESRQLHYLWSFQGEDYFEDQLGKIISLTQIEKEIS